MRFLKLLREKLKRLKKNKEKKKKLEEFRKLKEETEKKDEEVYGPSMAMTRFNYREFEEFVNSIGRCNTEARVLFWGLEGFIDYKRLETELLSGGEAISFFEKAMEEFHFLLQPHIPFKEIPFREYRRNNKNGKRFVHLRVKGGHPTLLIAEYDLFVREK